MRMQARIALFFVCLTTSFAQTNSFPKPSYFRETFAHSQTRVVIANPVKLKDAVVDGKLSLSLKTYLELVMANNTDIAIQMLTVESPKNAITRAFAPWDPQALASFSDPKSSTPSTGALQGAATVVSVSQPANFSYSQTLPTGMQWSVSFGASKSSTNSSFATLNPALSSSLTVGVSQPLIRNRGTYVNRLNLMMARSRLKGAEYNLRGNLLQLVNNAESAYWDLVQAHENLRVQESARKLADDSLKLSQKQLELGAISPLDIYNPQQQLASAELGVSQARFQVTQAENALRRQMGADLEPDVRNLPIEVTEAAALPLESVNYEAETEVAKALAGRPEIKAALQSLDLDDMGIAQAKNEILPDLSLTAQYSTQGVGGIFYQRANVFDNSGTASTITTVIPGGFGDSLSQMFGFGYPIYTFGATLRLPIKNHAATADMADAVVSKKRDALTLRTAQQQVRLDVLTAITNLESSKDSVRLAIVARDFAQKNLAAENQKYQLGTEAVQFVLQAQTTLAQAESAVVTNQVGLRRSILNLLARTGELLDERGIVLQ